MGYAISRHRQLLRLICSGTNQKIAGRVVGMTHADIARKIGRHRSVVGREIRRNISPHGKYDASVAHAWAAHRARRPKGFKLLNHPLAHQISNWIEDGWSPNLIAEMMGRLFADDRGLRVSHETIYQCLYVQTRGSLRADLARPLSTRRTVRKPRDRVGRRGKPYVDAFTIRDRPAEVEDRAVPGHWEGDLVRHEALCDRAEVKDLRRCAVAAA